MPRNLIYNGLILRSRPSGESNREIWLLAAEAGLIRATVFGGPKSRLRAYASPFHSGQVWIYHNPVKDTRKLSDFDVRSWRPGLRELYERAAAADAVAETVLASHGGGGNWERALALAEAALDALAVADEESCARVVVWFLWQWVDFLGLMPEFDCCSFCGKNLDSGAARWYSPKEGGVICGACRTAEPGAGLWKTGPGCRQWLEAARLLAPDQLARSSVRSSDSSSVRSSGLISVDKTSFREAQALAASILAGALGKRLACWDTL